ncbi:MAG TPA: hypothetical protein VH639_12965 [Bryobacteraceae bacterium]
MAAAACIAAGLTLPRSRGRAFLTVDRAITRFASHRARAVLFVGALPLIVRIALFPVLGIPQPLVADEFGYLLLADTFASGRLTNPTHPFWKHFEAIYVFHQPTYTSIYPVAPALLLALAKVIGAHPWLGVWFGDGLMCALVCWMLQGWLPPKWAFLGGLLAVCRFTIVSPWMNTYWGGATAAIGGALVLGALPRIMASRRIRDALLFALGLGILAESRPFEGIFFALPLAAMLGWWLLKEKRIAPRLKFTRVALPLAFAMTALAGWVMWYQWRVTGNPFLSPYILHQRIYGTPQPMLWQPPVLQAPGVNDYRDIADVFHWQLEAHQAGFSWSREGLRLQAFWQFYLQPLLTLPLLFLPSVLRKPRMPVLLLSAIALLAGNAMYPFFYTHYAAPLCGLMILFVVIGMRHLRALRIGSRRVGRKAFRGLLLMIAAGTIATTLGGMLEPQFVSATITPRGEILKQLKAHGGKHLVLVRYSPEHEFHYGVVFNDADIDRSPVVWARRTDPAGDKLLANYFRDRDSWFFNPDESPPRLIPFTGKAYISAVVPAAGRRDDIRDGVSPGGIALIMGGNFAHGVHGTENLSLLPGLPFRLAAVSPERGDVFAPGESARLAAAPLSFDGLSVLFGSIPSRILAISNMNDQETLTVQVPFETPPGEAPVTLVAGSGSFTIKVAVLPAAPGIFQMRTPESGIEGIVLRSDGSIVDQSHPAHPGEKLRMFATGLGPMTAAEADRSLIIGVNDHGAKLVSAVYAQGMSGVAEITFQIPPDVPPRADVPLSVGVRVNGKTAYSNKSSLPVR